MPESEFEETEHKAAALRRAIEMAAGVPETPRPGSTDPDGEVDSDFEPAPSPTGAAT